MNTIKKGLPLLAFLAGAAHAENAYVGLAYTQASNDAVCQQTDDLVASVFNNNVDKTGCADTVDGKKLTFGYKLFPWLGFELGYLAGTDFSGRAVRLDTNLTVEDKIKASIDGAELSVVGYLPLPGNVMISANAGVFSWSAEYSMSHVVTGETTEFEPSSYDDSSESGQGSKFGVGMVWVGDEGVALTIGFDRYLDMPDELGFEEEMDVASVGFQVLF